MVHTATVAHELPTSSYSSHSIHINLSATAQHCQQTCQPLHSPYFNAPFFDHSRSASHHYFVADLVVVRPPSPLAVSSFCSTLSALLRAHVAVMSSTLLRCCLLVVCLAAVLSVVSGWNVHWTIYNDATCSNTVVSGSDLNSTADSSSSGQQSLYRSTTCISLPGISGVQSAYAACINTSASSTQAAQYVSGLVLYTDLNCTNAAPSSTMISQNWSSCANSSSTTGSWGPVSARVDCNLPTPVKNAASRINAPLSLALLTALLAALNL